jgi:hypothetical protein
MVPKGWKGKLVFAPYAAYLIALGALRLPFWTAPDAADPDTAAQTKSLFERRSGARMGSLPESAALQSADAE